MAQLTHALGHVEPQQIFFWSSHIFAALCHGCIVIILIDRGHPEIKVILFIVLPSSFSLPRGQQ